MRSKSVALRANRAVLADVEPQGADEAARVFAPGDFIGGESARCRDIGQRGQVQRKLLQSINVLAFAIVFDDLQRISPVKRLAVKLQQREIDLLEAAVDEPYVYRCHAQPRDVDGDIFVDRIALVLRTALKAADQPVKCQQAKGLTLLVNQTQGQRQFRALLEAQLARQLPEQAVAGADFSRDA